MISNKMATGMFENDSSGNCLQPPTVPDSPDSIPLPDSPPPEIEDRGELGEIEENVVSPPHPPNNPSASNGRVETVPRVTISNSPSTNNQSRTSRKSSRKPRLAEEYDPSEPLTSSDEEEHIAKSPSPKYSQEDRPVTNSSTANNISPISNNKYPTLPDLNSIPVPLDENRRPVIHFSIPTRHRLLPISTLIKRQKGNLRKDGKGDGLQQDAGKVFGFDKSLDGDDEDEEDDDDDSRPKISLVAEIFGSDDENEDETEQLQAPDAEIQNRANIDQEMETRHQSLLPESDTQQKCDIDPTSGRWKIVADEASISNVETAQLQLPLLPPTIDNDTESGELATTGLESVDQNDESGNAEDEPEIIEIVTINVPPSSNRLRPLRRRPFLGARLAFDNGGEPEVIDIDKDEPVVVEPPPVVEAPPIIPSPSPPPRTPPPAPEVSRNDIERGRVRPEPDSSPERERHFKRPHSSSSMSNCEEGEIVYPVNPNKKRKKDRKKKTKRRKRSKDSISPPPKPSEKRVSDDPPPNTSDNEQTSRTDRSAISWRKPSKRSQNRNYRDGKPKADDTFFREKDTADKHRSSSPSHRRSRTTSRREKSPPKEKPGAKHRREGSPKNRSHSKSPIKFSRSRSRDSGKAYRNRRRNRHSRSKSSNSVSDKSRSGRSSSRIRSRRRYRRSTSRHNVGDSRSPSYITEPIRSRSSHYSKLRDRSRSRSRDRHVRGRHRKRTVSRSKSLSPASRAHKKNRKPESLDRQQKKKQVKEKEKQEGAPPEVKEKKVKEKEKVKEREKEKRNKKKEKPKEEEKPKAKEKEKTKEKEKKKKKKRREKSPTPVKAIVADGDSIVVSLSFQKGKTASSSNVQSCASSEDRNDSSLDTSANSESSSKQLPKPNNEGGNNSGFSEEPERAQNSPEKLSNVTDDEEGNVSPPEVSPERSKQTEEKETEAVKVTSSGGGSCGSNSPFEGERSFSAAADSTKIVTPQQNEQHESSFSRRTSLSPTDVESNAQGDSLVTSTGDSIEPPAVADDESTKSSSTPSKPTEKHFPGLSHKTLTSSVSPRFSGTQSSASDTSATSPATSLSLSNTSNSQSSSAPVMTRPLIGNIPGLYPSNAIINTGGAAPVPPPIVIPTPPPPQGIRFSGGSAPMLNPNVLASVASALLAVRQNPPGFSQGKLPAVGGMTNNSDTTPIRHMNVLAPRTQNFSLQSTSRSGGGNSFSQSQEGGDSPMSPNSSDGDDLFEPPTERTDSETGTNVANGSGKAAKNGQAMCSGGMGNDAFNSAGNSSNKPRERSTLFDSLFGGGDGQKAAPNKPNKVNKSKQKHRKGPKKETIKVNTSGGQTEGELRLTDEVPTSAVELIVKQKYLKKLNRQERVVEEVKLALKPYYSKRQLNKDEYKEILRRAVPKICHNKTGEINPGKIKELVEAYVKKFRHARKRGLDISSVK
ncbi:PHD and RING finger domain-containing protein 1 [Orchesella cincta]|uniref:PHD and RING finger domain-containing protein 1 n=1 Tax=Orchesella cincta TaxID=48709 RepID=A0A1D2ML24_ORCCI|nr:PHD and RING finger domain-containing protein 1 [Orchesella cincta]